MTTMTHDDLDAALAAVLGDTADQTPTVEVAAAIADLRSVMTDQEIADLGINLAAIDPSYDGPQPTSSSGGPTGFEAIRARNAEEIAEADLRVEVSDLLQRLSED